MNLEKIMCVPASVLPRLHIGQGFTPDADKHAYNVLLGGKGLVFHHPRASVEEDPTWKQVIPYVVFKYGDNVFTYRRRNQTEGRLSEFRSIGIGGHVDYVEALVPEDSFLCSLYREIDEEVSFGNHRGEGVVLNYVGLVNDETTPVGLVHLGFVCIIDIDHEVIESNEKGIVDCRFESIASWSMDEFEPWSRMVLEAMRDGKID